MNKIKFGIVGAGNQGSYYASLLTEGKIENGQLIAVCDNDPSKIERAKTRFHHLSENSFFLNHKDMIESGICDAIIVATPHYFHPEIVMDCLAKGINVICDKPAGVYTKQVRIMNEFALKCNSKFTMMFNQRTNCVYRKMKEMISQGVLGTLQRVTWIITDWYRTQFYYNNGEWRATWSGEGGGVLINQCPHQIDLLQWVLGELPSEVSAHCHYGKWHDIEVEDDVTTYLEFKNGATGVFVTTTGEAPGTNRLEVSGTKGKLLCENDTLIFYENEIDSQDNSKVSHNGYDKPNYKQIIIETDGKNPQHVGVINNFANHLLGLEDLFIEGVEGINGVELHNAISLSGWKNGASVTLPVNEEEYLEELNKRKLISKKLK